MNFNLTLIGQTIAFIIFVWFTMKFVWPLLTGIMAEREKRIADGLAAAEQGQEKFAEAERRYVELVDEGKQHAAQIIGQAERRRDEIIEEAKGNARDEGRRLLDAAHSEIEQEREQAREALRQQVAALALAGAEQILGREVHRNIHDELLQKISNSL